MGYDLEMRVTKMCEPDSELVLLRKDMILKNVKRVTGGKVGEWDKGNMWRYMEMDNMPLDSEWAKKNNLS